MKRDYNFQKLQNSWVAEADSGLTMSHAIILIRILDER